MNLVQFGCSNKFRFKSWKTKNINRCAIAIGRKNERERDVRRCWSKRASPKKGLLPAFVAARESEREREREREREGWLTFELFQLQQNQTNLSMDEVGANSPYSWGRYVKTFFIVSYNLKIKAEPGADMMNKF